MALNIYIGYDAEFGEAAFEVCAASIMKHASIPVNIVRLEQNWLRRVGLYRRTFYKQGDQYYDSIDSRPFSTQFSFTRFLVPSLQPDGWALFCDSDFLFRDDVALLLEYSNKRCAMSCVPHDFRPPASVKMKGQIQDPYPRKNWSSLVLWNCDHPSTRMLTPYQVNTAPGNWLHQFAWLKDEEIGELPEEWNWLDGHSDPAITPSAVHFTRGTPDMPGWENTQFAEEWMATWAGL